MKHTRTYSHHLLYLLIFMAVSSCIPETHSSYILLPTRTNIDRSSYHDNPAIRPFTGGLLHVVSGVPSLSTDYPLRIRKMDFRQIFNI
ncbi:unnamed protein product [Auanema sp. JU1783]|nr:unnamed protein product [Auanema sp. JU1783]